jgi:hypothetical protein
MTLSLITCLTDALPGIAVEYHTGSTSVTFSSLTASRTSMLSHISNLGMRTTCI